MTGQQALFSQARDRLVRAVTGIGFPADLGVLCARQIGSLRGIDRLTDYVNSVHPRSMEMVVDEALAIADQISTWREKKESEAAQWRYSLWLNSDERESD